MPTTRDMQEDKEPLFDAVETVFDSLTIYAAMLPQVKIQGPTACCGRRTGSFSNATDLADYLVREKGVSFREAHRITGGDGKLIALVKALLWRTFPWKKCRPFTRASNKGVYEAIIIENSIDSRRVFGGGPQERWCKGE